MSHPHRFSDRLVVDSSPTSLGGGLPPAGFIAVPGVLCPGMAGIPGAWQQQVYWLARQQAERIDNPVLVEWAYRRSRN